MPQQPPVDVHRKYAARGYETVAVAVKHDSPAKVADYAARRALPFKMAFDRTGEPNWKELDGVIERALAARA